MLSDKLTTMRILLNLYMIFVTINHVRCKIDLKKLNADEVIIEDIDISGQKSQYRTADFHANKYNYGYDVDVGPFHHETRVADGVTYGCYGYIGRNDELTVTHYVADSRGYRTIEYEKPILVYPINGNDVLKNPNKSKGIMLDWKELYFPIGCGMANGVLQSPNGEQTIPISKTTGPTDLDGLRMNYTTNEYDYDDDYDGSGVGDVNPALLKSLIG